MPTKEQERKALAKIREIVESLGEDSYIGTALDGCLDDAAENIENDFALSMRERYETAAAKLAEEEKKTALLTSSLEFARRQVITIEEASALWSELFDNRKRRETERGIAADAILANMENPASPEFVNAREEYRTANKRIERLNTLLDRMEEIYSGTKKGENA